LQISNGRMPIRSPLWALAKRKTVKPERWLNIRENSI
jgi:hypothetical protein